MTVLRTSDLLNLAVHERGSRERPTLVAVHGYPDDHRVWSGVFNALGGRFHLVSYDVRGAGESDRPRGRAAYRMSQLVDDLVRVIDEVSPDAKVHLVGHDWGSIQCWALVTDSRFAHRVASFTSISGPDLAHAATWFRRGREHKLATLKQLAASSYLGLFQLPAVPEMLTRRGVIDQVVRRSEERGRPADEPAPSRDPEDLRAGLQLYRANMLGALASPRPRSTPVPVQVIAPEDDPHVTPALQLEAPKPYAENLVGRVIDGNHWVVRHRPGLIAELIVEFAPTAPGG